MVRPLVTGLLAVLAAATATPAYAQSTPPASDEHALDAPHAGETTSDGTVDDKHDERRGSTPEGSAEVDEAQPAKTDEERHSGPPRRRDASVREVFKGPFRSSRLFSMPTTDVIGAYMFSLSGDASLLQETGLLTSAGVAAIGFGDIAQLEYRHSAAISISGVNAPLPGIGVQLKLPIPEFNAVPAFGVAFRLGVPRVEVFDGVNVEERVSDLYLVGRLHIDQVDWLTLHGGVRVSSAQVQLSGAIDSGKVQKTLWLPTAGYEIRMNKEAAIVGEIALAPQFRWMRGTQDDPTIGYGLLGRLGVRWALFPSVIIDGSIGYQLEVAHARLAEGPDDVVHWDIRLGAEVFVPWGALACRATGAFCD